MPAYSIKRPRRATPRGATTRPIQKFPIAPTSVTRRYAPTANSAPCAKLGMLRIPVISNRPSPIRAYSIPVAIPFRTWPASRLKAEGSEASDVLAGCVFLGQRRVAGGDDVREIQLVLHRRLRLAAQEEVGAQRLVRGAVDPHRPDDVVHLEALERLDDGLHVVGLRLVEAGEQHPRHRVGGRRRVARRQLEPGLVALDEALRHRRVCRVVEVRADPQVVADLRRELHQLLHPGGPAHDEGQLGREAEVEDLAGAGEIFNFGLTPKLPLIMSWSSGVEELVQLAPEIRDNLWVGTNFYYTADTPVAKSFVKSYQARFKLPPGYAPSAAYSMTRMLLAGFDKAKSDDVQAVVKSLEGLEMNDIVGPMRVDGATHQTLRPYFFLRCKPKAAMKHELDFADVIATGDAPLPKEYAACKDIGSL